MSAPYGYDVLRAGSPKVAQSAAVGDKSQNIPDGQAVRIEQTAADIAQGDDFAAFLIQQPGGRSPTLPTP